jgi:Group II intron, maturase-specific domain
MTLGEAGHQKPGQPGRTVAGRGEAASEAVSDEATLARHAQTDWGAGDLLGQALARENMAAAWKRVKANKGSAGVDARTVQDTGEYLKQARPDIRGKLQGGSYRPDPVRRVGIPKSGSGDCFWAAKDEAKRAVADQAMHKLRERIRQLTRRTRGRNLEQIAEDLRAYVPGWKAYFRLAQTPKVMRELDEWLRHRLRAVQLKQWRRGTTMFRAPRKLGASVDLAARIAGNARRWWRNSRMVLNMLMPIAYFDRLGVPRFS